MTKTIRLKGKHDQYFTAELVAYQPDWDYRLKFRGHALVLLNPGFRLAPFLLSDIAGEFAGGVVRVNEVFIHSMDNKELRSLSRKRHDGMIVIFNELVYEAWRLRLDLDTHLFRQRQSDTDTQDRIRRVLHKSGLRLWRRSLTATPGRGVCTWQYHDEHYDYWQGDCGIMWSLEEGTPTHHEMAFCPKCGKKLGEMPVADEEEE